MVFILGNHETHHLKNLTEEQHRDLLAEYQRAGSLSAIQIPESQLSFFAVVRAPSFSRAGHHGPTEEKTLAARALGFVEEAIMPSKTGEQRAVRAGRNEFVAEIIADTVAMLPCTKWYVAGGFRSLFLSSSDKGVTGAGLDFVQGAALNKVARLAMPGSRMTTLFEKIENKAMREVATHATVGLGFGLASTGFRPESWHDKNGEFSISAGVTNVGSAGLLGAFINVPAGAIGSRIGKMTLNSSLSRKFALDDAYVLSNVTAGTTGGIIFGGVDALAHGRPVWESMLTGGFVGGFTGGTIGVATRPRYNFNPNNSLPEGGDLALAPAGKTKFDRPIIDKVGKGKHAEYNVTPEVYEKLHINVSARETPLEQRVAVLGPHDLVTYVQDVQKPGAASKVGDYKTFGAWARDWMVESHTPARRYTFGPNEVVVPEKYATQLDEVLNLRMIVEQERAVRAAGDADQIAALEAAKQQLQAHPMRDRAHAVDLIPFLEELPDRSLVKRIILHDNKNPEDPWHRKTYKPDFESAASAAEDGTVSYYEQNRDFFSRETTHHEWSHLLENKVKRESAANEAAFGYEKAWDPSHYSRRDKSEMFAEMGASLLHPDGDQFLLAAHKAPVRTAIYTSAMEQALNAVPAPFRSVFAAQYQARVNYVKENILPQARLELSGSLNGGNRADRVASAKVLGLIGNQDSLLQLKGMAQQGHDASTTKAAFEAARDYVTRGKRGLANYELLNPEQTVNAQATYLAEMAQKGSASRQMAIDGLYQMRGTSERARLFHELFVLGNRKNVTGVEQARALKIVDDIPDTLGKQMALRETLNLTSDPNTRVDLALSAMTRNPSLHVEGLRTVADLAQPRTKAILEMFAAGDDPVARDLAKQGLAKIARTETVDKAIAGLKDPNTHERQISITELAATKDRRAIKPLVDMYLHGETMIEQRLAAEMLEQNFARNLWRFEVKTMTRGTLLGERLRSLMMGVPIYDGK